MTRNLEADPSWTPARIYLAIAGPYLVVTGIVGFWLDRSFPIGADAKTSSSADIFGIFETNGWHNVAGLVLGLIALYFLARPEHADLGALAVGIPGAIVTIAFAVEDPRTFWFASNAADNVVHALLGVGGIIAYFATVSLKKRSMTPAQASSL